jgi:hypothetical protein
MGSFPAASAKALPATRRLRSDDVLQELRIETFFPADAESEAMWRRLIPA